MRISPKETVPVMGPPPNVPVTEKERPQKDSWFTRKRGKYLEKLYDMIYFTAIG